MDVFALSAAGIVRHEPADLPALLADDDVLVWVDMASCSAGDATVLVEQFGFHDLAVRDCVERNHVSKIHVYPDHVFTVVHAPERGRGGHVHFVELDQFVGTNYLVTVHGPLNPAVDAEVATIDTRFVHDRIAEGLLRPESPMALSVAILGSLVRREVGLVADLARDSGKLERQVTDDDRNDDPETLLESLYEVRQQLLAVRTMAAHAQATYHRLAVLDSFAAPERALATDIAQRLDFVRSIADTQRDFVHGVAEFFQARTGTHLTIATEKLAATSVRQNDDMRRITAWVAIIAVPTAVTGFFGQNVPYPGFAETSGFVASCVVIVVVAVLLYVAFKRRSWL